MKKSILAKGMLAFFAATTIVSCHHNNSQNIEGAWVALSPDSTGTIQGIILEEDGKASSMAPTELQYESWQQEGDMLILSGGSIGSGQSVSVIDTFTIVKATDTELVLQNDGMTVTYEKQQ